MNNIFTKKTSYGAFLKYLLPSILSMVFVSFYTTIDGFFVSHYVGSNALAGINILLPITCVSFGLAIMLSTGAGAIVGMRLGEGKKEEADGFFSFIFFILCGISVVFTILGLVFLEPILRMCGSTDILMPYTIPYGIYTILMTPAVMIKLFLECFARVDGNPRIAMIMSTVGLVLNLIFDYIFIVPMGMGIGGAGLGTALSIILSALIGIAYFFGSKSKLKIKKPKANWKALGFACFNGSSEMFTELSTGITALLFNLMLLKYCGENGVAAMSVLTYMFYLFIAVYFGVAVGVQPIISYSIGSKNLDKIREIIRYSTITIAWSSVLVFLVSFTFAGPIVRIFTPDPAVISIAVSGLKLFSLGFLFIGINVFISGYFTAVGNGAVSALISLCRSLVFILVFLTILTHLFGLNGIWLTMPAAEMATLLVSFGFVVREKNILPNRTALLP